MTCRCQICKCLYTGDLLVNDNIWELIKPDGKPTGAGLLCGRCIVDRIVERTHSTLVIGTTEAHKDNGTEGQEKISTSVGSATRR